jgi:hypothetical protein
MIAITDDSPGKALKDTERFPCLTMDALWSKIVTKGSCTLFNVVPKTFLLDRVLNQNPRTYVRRSFTHSTVILHYDLVPEVRTTNDL